MHTSNSAGKVSAPLSPVEPSTRTLHGETVTDPYAWMRDHDDPRLLEYLVAERQYFDEYSRGIAPLVEELQTELAQRQVNTAYSFTWQVGDYEYFIETPDGSRHPRYVRRPAGSGEVEVVLDLGELGSGRDFTRIGVFEPSPDGRWLAYSVDHVGYESYQLRVRDLHDGQDLPRSRERTYYTGAWNADSTSFFYTVHDDSMRPCQVFSFALNADSGTSDRLVWTELDRRFNTTLRTTRNRSWIVISNQSRTTSEELLIPAGHADAEPRPVCPRKQGQTYFTEHQLTSSLDRFVLLVADGNEERRLVGVPAQDLDGQQWEEVLPSDPAMAWQRLDLFADGLLLSGYRRGTSVFQFFGVDGSTHEFVPESPAGCLIFEGRRDPTRVQLDNRTAYAEDTIVLTEHSLVDPPRHHRIALATGTSSHIGQDLVTHYDRKRYRTERLATTAPDGTSVPITIAYREDVRANRTAPCLLYCYGAYERAWEPVFSSPVISLLDHGFVYAIAHVRGGGELGRKGWIDGRMTAKQNSFADLLAAREHLVTLGWAATDKIVCHGSCAGGIVTGQAYTERPELWAGHVAEAPAIDLLNAMLEEDLPLTINEFEEWGDPRDAEIYRLMRRYVAYENVSDRPRPPLLITAFYNDPRVLVHEPARWAAALRQADTHGNRILLRTELGDGGHHGPSVSGSVAVAVAELHAFVIDAGTRGHWREDSPVPTPERGPHR